MMAQEVNVGGERLGSGKKSGITQELHNYMMNSFNLSRDWKSTMAPGILYPCLKEIAHNHGTFDIDCQAFVRTLPTRGPLLGSFKLQVDFFNVPFRLYQGLLHNNPVDIGMSMNQVYLPKIMFRAKDGRKPPMAEGTNYYTRQVNNTALEKYLGLSGYGTSVGPGVEIVIARKLQCMPELGYYDIFKNYYSNKQEEKAYVITPEAENIREENLIYRVTQGGSYTYEWSEVIVDYNPYNNEQIFIKDKISNNYWDWNIFVNKPTNVEIENEGQLLNTINVIGDVSSIELDTLKNTYNASIVINNLPDDPNKYQVSVFIPIDAQDKRQNFLDEIGTKIQFEATTATNIWSSDIKLTPFALKNIDKMRAALLSKNELGQEFVIGTAEDWNETSGADGTGMPYIALAKTTTEGISWNAFRQNGLLVKTYQSDIFNNWLDSETVDKISQRSKVNTTNGAFSIDTLILQEKIYEMLNRIAISGGTYQDWQDANYGEGGAKIWETPMYVGGMSAEIQFEEVLSTSESNIKGDFQPLGSMGGRGTIAQVNGGHNIHVRFDEPGYLMAICSLTPRVVYSQGNDWDRTELDSMDDLHKPALDQIGFQDIMIEQAAWWNTRITSGGAPGRIERDSMGKQIAWINYQTAVDKAYGEFADQGGVSFMVLNRNYEMGMDSNFNKVVVEDLTTYIDPAKYNYAFANADLASQNFWVRLHFNLIARRKMGAQQLPNL